MEIETVDLSQLEIDELKRQVAELRKERDYYKENSEIFLAKLDAYSYNYNEEVAEAIREWLDEWEETPECTREAVKAKYGCIGELEDELTERMRMDDHVTGIQSGSFTYDREAAEKNLAHNRGLLVEAYEYLGFDSNIKDMRLDDAEECDARIREYVVCVQAPRIIHATYGYLFREDRKASGSSKSEAR